MFKKILSFFWGWETVCLTRSMEEYARIRGRLINNGVKTKIKVTNNSSNGIGSAMPISTNYEILVRKEEAHRANEIIHSRW
ncbi:hypothetical protein Desor_2161 [Desulfosporosinus orientis DSM 765]|uniref:DUF2007 domain-containing protein n=1 Tax=Desulfosporosinus orientis (strain ATCC 19365 / DSM 765 / NCIMB 8382 / VKM B-1628 / Singapore I) TaxID=768706 RepID=G7W8Q5_DESOD|nr:hypothetical protein [Desulfosporosinus orientis]AET67765.1 hypothetical protein Desor_2161 [Desulfosporosinus orientis DSM 765]